MLLVTAVFVVLYLTLGYVMSVVVLPGHRPSRADVLLWPVTLMFGALGLVISLAWQYFEPETPSTGPDRIRRAEPVPAHDNR